MLQQWMHASGHKGQLLWLFNYAVFLVRDETIPLTYICKTDHINYCKYLLHIRLNYVHWSIQGFFFSCLAEKQLEECPPPSPEKYTLLWKQRHGFIITSLELQARRGRQRKNLNPNTKAIGSF